jgi:hypothetical protein
MSGPLPKPRSIRQRKNRKSTRAVLVSEEEAREAARERPAPRLPRREAEGGEARPWHKRTLAWWRDTWVSPMAAEYLQADIHQLHILAELMDSWHYSPSLKVAAEIRQHRMAFGQTPIDRRRLEWEADRVESTKRRGIGMGLDAVGAGDITEAKATTTKRSKKPKDARDHLRIVNR